MIFSPFADYFHILPAKFGWKLFIIINDDIGIVNSYIGKIWVIEVRHDKSRRQHLPKLWWKTSVL
jgi:hypothetical protein